MRTFLAVCWMLVAACFSSVAQSAPPSPVPVPSPPASQERISSMIKKGEVYQLETTVPLIDGADRVTILDFGPKSWVLVAYEASVLPPGELLPKLRKGEMWINFDQVMAARKIVPEVLMPIAEESGKVQHLPVKK